jgi:hypothetical protein
VSRPLTTAVVAGFVLAALPARAHVRLVSPVSRYGDEMKFGPCGRLTSLRTNLVTTLRPGQTIEVVFDEIVGHPGYYRIAFDPSGDDDLGPPEWDGASLASPTFVNPQNVQVLADHVPDAPGGVNTHGVVSVQLPDIECDSCTLQLIQVMTDKPPYDGVDDFYYQCADLVLSRTLQVGGPPPRSFDSPPLDSPTRSGGCASARGGTTAPALLLALAALLPRRVRPRDDGKRS